MPDFHDTIVALSSPAGPGGRAIVRLSGPDALRIAGTVFTAAGPVPPHPRHCYPGELRLPGVAAPLPADLHVWPAPRTYTGQQLLELHTLSSPPLVELLVARADEDIHFAGEAELLGRISKGLALVTLLGKQLEQRSLSGETFRAVLVGRPNVGKSSLFNALAGAAALVSPEPGTTRDYLVRRLDLGGVPVDLVDTAGWQESPDSIGEQAQALGRDQAGRADLVLLCLEAGRPPDPAEAALLAAPGPPVLAVATKCDLAEPPPGVPATSAVTGAGLESLRELLAERARSHARPPLAPSLSRCRHHVAACLAHLRQAHSVALFQEPPELLAMELRGALDQLGEMVGAVYTEDLLDRIFSRFCIGK
jgi:tRNA modification GTPase